MSGLHDCGGLDSGLAESVNHLHEPVERRPGKEGGNKSLLHKGIKVTVGELEKRHHLAESDGGRKVQRHCEA